MTERNPFSLSYLTEASVSPEDLLAQYSFLPFTNLQAELSAVANVFLVGRKGVGKTMLLKAFEPEFQQLIYDSSVPEHQKIRERLPLATIGLYLNLASPSSRLTLFQGRHHDARWWIGAYADFLNSLLLDMAIDSLQFMLRLPRWAESHCRTVPKDPFFYAAELLEGLREESSDFDDIKDIAALRLFLRGRVRHWARFVNQDPSVPEPPRTPLALGVPLFQFVRAIRSANVLRKPFRVFLLLDQYEYLYQHRNTIDFRPMFNQAMYEAARGGTGVEFKIGTRPYSYKNFELLEKGGKIEAGREMQEVDLDYVFQSFYRKFAIDLFEKRLAHVAGVRPLGSARATPQGYLPTWSATDEAHKYVRDAASDSPRHIAAFTSRWELYGLPREVIESILRDKKIAGSEPLAVTLACIAISRWLKSGRGAPVGCRPRTGRPQKVVRPYLVECIGNIEHRYRLGSNAAGKLDKSLRSVDYFVRDAEQAALFQLASIYKNQRKYFSGLDAIIRVSSNVAIVLIEILKAAYERHILDGEDVRNAPVRPELQSDAIYRVSESWFSRITSECDYGESLQELIRNWGGIFRKLQLEVTAPQPCPNGFSFQGDLFVQEGEPSPRENYRRLLADAVTWGLLEEQEHQDKTRGKPKRRKLYLNRVFCPYFGISEIRRKDPIYVSDVNRFFLELYKGDTPSEIRDVLVGRSQVDHTQPLLFS